MEIVATKIARLRDEELVRIAFGGDAEGFEENYVDAARSELERRGGAPREISDLREELVELKIEEDLKASQPLGTAGRVLFFLFGALWLTWLATVALKYQGYDQKFRDAWRWIIYGFGMWAVIAALFALGDWAGH